MNSKMYPKSWVLRKIFNENDGDLVIKGEKNILKYSDKDEEYWLVNINEYFNKGKKTLLLNAPYQDHFFFFNF